MTPIKKVRKGVFVKGDPRAGRPKGCKSKFTTLKDAFLEAFQDIGGKDQLAKFATKPKNQKEFFKMVSHMLPRDVHMSGTEGQPLIPLTITIVPIEPKITSTDEQ